MDDITANLIVLAVLLLLGGAILLIVRRRSAARWVELERVAHEQRWRLEKVRQPHEGGVRIEGRGWTLEALARSSGTEAGPGSSDMDTFTRFRADRPGSTLLLGGRLSPGSLPESLLRPAVQMLTGQDLPEVPLRNPALGGRYMLRAADPAEAESWLTHAAEAALLAWEGTPPLIRRDDSGLEMKIQGERLMKAEDLLAFVRMGEALLE
jgi:hypothetical protein